MRLLVLSHKETWSDPASPTGYSTTGGFPFQMQAISKLFDQTTLLVLRRAGLPIPGLRPLVGHNLTVQTLPEPSGTDLRRKLALLIWLPRYLPMLWKAVKSADVIHAPVPGDLGSIGIMLALLQGKRLFVRHCGTFGEPQTVSDRLLLWLLERIAGERNIVIATGGAEFPPSRRNPNITWIFSTTLTQDEIEIINVIKSWSSNESLRLVTVGRVAHEKNMTAIIEALPLIRAVHLNCQLDIVGDGAARSFLEKLAHKLGVEDAVTFHGNVNHARVMQILSQSHLFVFPTRVKEGFPKAVLEALACGLPVIATRVSVIPQLLKNGSGVLLDDTSAPAVANAILELLAAPEKLGEMGTLAREAAQGYTLEAWGETIGQRLRAAWGPLKSGDA